MNFRVEHILRSFQGLHLSLQINALNLINWLNLHTMMNCTPDRWSQKNSFNRLSITSSAGLELWLRGFWKCSHIIQNTALSKVPRVLAGSLTHLFQHSFKESLSPTLLDKAAGSIGKTPDPYSLLKERKQKKSFNLTGSATRYSQGRNAALGNITETAIRSQALNTHSFNGIQIGEQRKRFSLSALKLASIKQIPSKKQTPVIIYRAANSRPGNYSNSSDLAFVRFANLAEFVPAGHNFTCTRRQTANSRSNDDGFAWLRHRPPMELTPEFSEKVEKGIINKQNRMLVYSILQSTYTGHRMNDKAKGQLQFKNQRAVIKEVEKIRRIVVETRDCVREPSQSQVTKHLESAVQQCLDINRLSEQIYQRIERKLQTERERRGLC